jgi:hypothetical protein
LHRCTADKDPIGYVGASDNPKDGHYISLNLTDADRRRALFAYRQAWLTDHSPTNAAAAAKIDRVAATSNPIQEKEVKIPTSRHLTTVPALQAVGARAKIISAIK